MSALKLPKGETLWVSYFNKAGERVFALTSRENSRDWYYLYDCAGSALKKLGRAKSPTELEEKFQVEEKMMS